MRHIFFSFHYSFDLHRIQTVLNVFLNHEEFSCTPFISDEEIERMKREGLDSIHQWIESEIAKADGVVVLIGENSFGRYFIEYEIQTAVKLNKPLLGIFIDQISDINGNLGVRGKNPLPEKVPVFDWKEDKGEENIYLWIENMIHESRTNR